MDRPRILVVDDDADFAASLADILAIPGYNVETALSGEEAVVKCRETPFDIALVDVRMPGMDGVEAFFEIRALRPNTRVAMITGYSVEQLMDQAVAGGTWSPVRQPFTEPRLVEMLARTTPNGVLLVEDDPAVIADLQMACQVCDRKVLIAHQRQEAVEAAGAHQCDALILDLQMPILCALAVYREARASGHAGAIIIVTGWSTKELYALDEVTSFSVTGVLTKSVDPRVMLQIVEGLAHSCAG